MKMGTQLLGLGGLGFRGFRVQVDTTINLA